MKLIHSVNFLMLDLHEPAVTSFSPFRNYFLNSGKVVISIVDHVSMIKEVETFNMMNSHIKTEKKTSTILVIDDEVWNQ